MTHNQMIDTLVFLRVKQMNHEFDARLSGHYDQEIDRIEIYGHCNKVHPDLVDVYKNGWELGHTETLDEAMAKCNLTLLLQEA